MSIVSLNITGVLRKAERLFSQARIPSARLDAEVLLAYLLNAERSWLHAHDKDEISMEQAQEYQKLVERRLRREPVAYIIGTKEFYGRELIVTPDVLIPRPETEDLVELALKESKLWSESMYGASPRVLDVGCGSGCVGITLKLERPEWNVTLVDISSVALVIARKNAHKLGAAVEFRDSNLLSSLEQGFSCDMIVANLPYVDKNWKTSPETAHEPALALYAEQHGLSLIFQLIERSQTVLRESGRLLLEADPEQHQAITDLAMKHGFAPEETRGYALSFMKQSQV